MIEELIILLKKQVRSEAGKNLSFKSLQAFIDNSDDRILRIMGIALVLGDKQTRDKESWKPLCNQFLSHYREEILGYYGYECGEPFLLRVKVTDEAAFVEAMAWLKKKGAFGTCSYRLLASRLLTVFDIPYSHSYLMRRMKEEGWR